MDRGEQGRWVEQSQFERHRAFVPVALPPVPPLDVRGLTRQLERANRALGRLDGVSMMLPDTKLLLYFYVRKEAVLSSQIEGTQSSLSDLLLYESTEAAGVPLEDVREVSQYVAATERALDLLRTTPLSSRLIRQVHQVLLSQGRGAAKQPGAFRKQPVWIGGTSPSKAAFVPPPWNEVEPCIAALETFLNDSAVPTLLKAALAHAQFETIHPFLDGNGRIGRLLIALVLVAEGALAEPLLYLSLFLRQHRERYYELLQATRLRGDWEGWLEFFLDGVESTATNAFETAKAALELFARHEALVSGLRAKSRLSVQAVYHQVRRHPVSDVAQLATAAKVSIPTATRAVMTLGQLGIVRELSGKERNRVYAYAPFLKLLQDDLPTPGHDTARSR